MLGVAAAMVAALIGTAAGAVVDVYRYNAPPVAPDFTISSTTVPLSGSCAPDRVARHVIYRLDAFDSGRARAFSRGFPARAAPAAPARWIFNPYGNEALPGYRPSVKPRPGIERIARALYRRGDGWTATQLGPPTGTDGPTDRAVYGLSLRVTRRGFTSYDAGAKLIVACDSGRITRWIGPIPMGAS